MRMRPRSALFLSSVVLLGSLASGCTPAPTDPSTGPSVSPESTEDTAVEPEDTTSPPPPSGRPGCALAPAALIKSTLGMNLHEPSESFSATEIDCTYLPVTEGGLTILLRFRVGQDHASFVTDRQDADTNGQPTTDVNDIGDEAYYSSTEFGITVTHTLVVRQGSVVVVVGAPVSLDAEKDLIRKILAALA